MTAQPYFWPSVRLLKTTFKPDKTRNLESRARRVDIVTDPSLGLQIAIRSRLISDSAVTDIVPLRDSRWNDTSSELPLRYHRRRPNRAGNRIDKSRLRSRICRLARLDKRHWPRSRKNFVRRGLAGNARRPLAIDGLVSFHVQGTRYLRDPALWTLDYHM